MKHFLLSLFVLMFAGVTAIAAPVTVLALFTAKTTTGAVPAVTLGGANKSCQAAGATTAGSGSATVKVQVSNTGNDWIDLATITLTLGTARTSDGFASNVTWKYYRGNVTALSGTGASVDLYCANATGL